MFMVNYIFQLQIGKGFFYRNIVSKVKRGDEVSKGYIGWVIGRGQGIFI